MIKKVILVLLVIVLVLIGIVYSTRSKSQVNISDSDLVPLKAMMAKYNLKGAVIEATDRNGGAGLASAWEISSSGEKRYLLSVDKIAGTGCGFFGCGTDFSQIQYGVASHVALSSNKSFVSNLYVTPRNDYQLQLNNSNQYSNEVVARESTCNSFAFERSPNGDYSVVGQSGPTYTKTALLKNGVVVKVLNNFQACEARWTPDSKTIVFKGFGVSGNASTGKATIYKYSIATDKLDNVTTIDNPVWMIDAITPTAYTVNRKGESYLAEVVPGSNTLSYTKIFGQNIKLVGVIPYLSAN